MSQTSSDFTHLIQEALLSLQQERLSNAITMTQKAIDVAPDISAGYLVLANILERAGRIFDAAKALDECRRAVPTDLTIYPPLIRLLKASNHHEEAKKIIRTALIISPGSPSLHVLAGSQETQIKRVALLEPSDYRLWTHSASIYATSLSDKMAIRCAQRAILLSPEMPLSYTLIPPCADRLYDYVLALNTAKWCLQITPDSHEMALSAGFCLFPLGDPIRGFELLERREMRPNEPRRIGLPRVWNGKMPAPKTLLVCAEQGIGDEYMFLTCLLDLQALTDKLIVECDARNISLYSRSFPKISFIPRTITRHSDNSLQWDYRPHPEVLAAEKYVLAGSLCGIFGVATTRPPQSFGYLKPSQNEAKVWGNWLASLGNLPKVGLCWRSGEPDPIRNTFYFSLDRVLQELGDAPVIYVSLLHVDPGTEILRFELSSRL